MIDHRPDEPGLGAAFADEGFHVRDGAREERQVDPECGPRLRVEAVAGPCRDRQDQARRDDGGHARQQRPRAPLPCLVDRHGHQRGERRDPDEELPVEQQRRQARDGRQRPVDEDRRAIALAEAGADPHAAREEREIPQPPGQEEGDRGPRRGEDDAGDRGDGDHEPRAMLIRHPTRGAAALAGLGGGLRLRGRRRRLRRLRRIRRGGLRSPTVDRFRRIALHPGLRHAPSLLMRTCNVHLGVVVRPRDVPTFDSAEPRHSAPPPAPPPIPRIRAAPSARGANVGVAHSQGGVEFPTGGDAGPFVARTSPRALPRGRSADPVGTRNRRS